MIQLPNNAANAQTRKTLVCDSGEVISHGKLWEGVICQTNLRKLGTHILKCCACMKNSSPLRQQLTDLWKMRVFD